MKTFKPLFALITLPVSLLKRAGQGAVDVWSSARQLAADVQSPRSVAVTVLPESDTTASGPSSQEAYVIKVLSGW